MAEKGTQPRSRVAIDVKKVIPKKLKGVILAQLISTIVVVEVFASLPSDKVAEVEEAPLQWKRHRVTDELRPLSPSQATNVLGPSSSTQAEDELVSSSSKRCLRPGLWGCDDAKANPQSL